MESGQSEHANQYPLSCQVKAKRCGNLFRDLHARPGILVLPNPWDAGTARMLENLGFDALATTSAGLAFSLGRRDGDGAVSREETFRHVTGIMDATNLPISADLENGFGTSPEDVARTIREAGALGLSGASIEDATYRAEDPLFALPLAVERIRAAAEAARALPHAFVLTARAENFIRGRADLDDVLRRLERYQQAGADVLYAPGLPDSNAIALCCRTLQKPFNYVAGVGPTRFSLAELEDLGVRRVTLGTSFVRTALAAFHRAAREVKETGTFDYLTDLPSVSDFNKLIGG